MKIEAGKDYWVTYAGDAGRCSVKAVSEDGNTIIGILHFYPWDYRGIPKELNHRHFVAPWTKPLPAPHVPLLRRIIKAIGGGK